MPLTYHIWTIGCQMNDADVRRLATHLERLGLEPAASAAGADLVVLNTCVVRQQAEDKVYGRLDYVRILKHKHPDMMVALMGCLVGKQASAEVRERFPFVDVFMPPSDFEPLLARLREQGSLQAPDVPTDDFDLPRQARGQTVCACVPVVLGCSHACSYCVIPYRRGGEKSRPLEEVVREAERLAGQGVREITVLGQIVDRYGLDLGGDIDLALLLQRLARIEGLARLRFLTNHPRWMTDRLLDVVANEPKVCPYFELPFQAGGDRVLKAMRRGYTSAEYLALIEKIRARLPAAAFSTDIIVGFPGETEGDFQESMRLLRAMDADMARIAKYSPRPLTYAARHLADDVPEQEKERRRQAVDDELRAMLTRKHADWPGRTVRVLVESRDVKKGRWMGRTPQNKIVFIEGLTGDARGRLVDVRLTWAGPFSLIGAPAS